MRQQTSDVSIPELQPDGLQRGRRAKRRALARSTRGSGAGYVQPELEHARADSVKRGGFLRQNPRRIIDNAASSEISRAPASHSASSSSSPFQSRHPEWPSAGRTVCCSRACARSFACRMRVVDDYQPPESAKYRNRREGSWVDRCEVTNLFRLIARECAERNHRNGGRWGCPGLVDTVVKLQAS